MRTKQKAESFSSILKRYSSYILFFGISVFLPLFMENGYLNLTQAKAHALYITVIPAVILFGIALPGIIKDKANRTPKVNVLDMILIGFAIVLCLSTLFSGNIGNAFWGNTGWSVGACTMLCLIFAYFVISRYFKAPVNAWLFVLVANIIIFLLTIFHSMGIDILGLHAAIDPKQLYLYVATLGNVNWLSGYLCIILPVFLVFFMLSTQRISVILYGAVLILGIINGLLCFSESIFVGIWVCGFFALPFILQESRRIQRLGALFLSLGLSALFIGLFPAFEGKMKHASGLFSIILNWKTALVICLLGCLCCFVLPILWEKLSKQTRHLILILLEVMMVVSIFVLIYAFLNSYDNDWGNKRGHIWNTSIELFRNFGIKDKLIGVGPELLGQYYDGLTSFSLIVLTAHNEWLQWLLTTGISGAVLWAALFLWLIISYIRSHCWEHEGIVFFLPLMAYFGQALLNSPNAMNISLFYLFLSLYQNHILSENVQAEI